MAGFFKLVYLDASVASWKVTQDCTVIGAFIEVDTSTGNPVALATAPIAGSMDTQQGLIFGTTNAATGTGPQFQHSGAIAYPLLKGQTVFCNGTAGFYVTG